MPYILWKIISHDDGKASNDYQDCIDKISVKKIALERDGEQRG
jgi:hypothetical protein